VASLLCGLAPDLPTLIAARALQGIGGGIAAPLGTAMLFAAFPPREQGLALGIFGVAVVTAPAIGPLSSKRRSPSETRRSKLETRSSSTRSETLNAWTTPGSGPSATRSVPVPWSRFIARSDQPRDV